MLWTWTFDHDGTSWTVTLWYRTANSRWFIKDGYSDLTLDEMWDVLEAIIPPMALKILGK